MSEPLFLYKENKKGWRFCLLRDLVVPMNISLGRHSFYDASGVKRLYLRGNLWRIKKGYSWDGCSPKMNIGGRWFGTPDFEASRLASLWHDSAYQFLHHDCFPLTRIECDSFFGSLINRDKRHFLSSAIYSNAVKVFGGIHRSMSDGNREVSTCGEHS